MPKSFEHTGLVTSPVNRQSEGFCPPKPLVASVSDNSARVAAHLVDASTWNALLDGFDDVSFEQCAMFAAGRWGAERTSYVVVLRDGEPIGGACVVKFALPIATSGVAYIKHGPVWRRTGCEPTSDNYRDLVSALRDEFGHRHGQGIVIIPRPNPVFAAAEQQMLGELGFLVRRDSTDPNRFLVDVALTEQEQLQSLEQKWRYNLRTAMKNGVVVAEATDHDGILAFNRLHAAMVARKKFANSDRIELIPGMMSTLPPRLRPHTFLAYHQGRPVAGAVIGVHGDTAYYLFGASDDTALSLNAGYALHWSIVRWLSSTSARWYDLGGEAGEHGLRQFKKGLVGKRGAIVTTRGEYEYANGPSAQLAMSAIMAIRTMRRAISDCLTSLTR